MPGADAPLLGRRHLPSSGSLYSHPRVFKFKKRSWQAVQCNDANSVGWCHPELCEWEDNQEINFPLLSTTPVGPRKAVGTHSWWVTFSSGTREGRDGRMATPTLEGFAICLDLNCQHPPCLLSRSLLLLIEHPQWGPPG